MQKRLDKKYIEYLVMRAKTGDRVGFDLLVEHCQNRFLTFALRLTGDAEMARDAVQDAWTDIVKSLDRLSDARLFNAWAYKIVSCRCVDQIRKLQRRRRTNAAYASEPYPQTQGSDNAEKSADTKAILELIKQLPEEQRVTMILFYSDDLGVAEIAHITGVAVGTVKTRLLHARRKIREQLEGDTDV